MTTLAGSPPTETRPPDGRLRRVDLTMARTHLRLGSLALARTELETLAGLGTLDAAGLVDLAEVRWRTGDLLGAGEAAVVALDAEADDPVAYLIAAEAASADGRPSEARRLAMIAMSRLHGRIDRVFAGMPRSAVWPPDADEPPPTAATLFHREAEDDAAASSRLRGMTAAGTAAAVTLGSSTEDAPEGPAGSAGPLTLGFWDADSGAAPDGEMPDPDEAFQAGRTALIAGAHEEAAFRFGLAIRFAPALAPAVLEATDGARSVPLIVVRGDAYRLVGHEAEARQAYALAAHGGPPERRRRPRTEQGHADPAAAAAAGLRRAGGPAPPEAVSPAEGMAAASAASPGDATAEGSASEAADPKKVVDPPDQAAPADRPDQTALADATDDASAAANDDVSGSPYELDGVDATHLDGADAANALEDVQDD